MVLETWDSRKEVPLSRGKGRPKPTFVDEHGVEYITLRLAETGEGSSLACTGTKQDAREA